MKDNPWHKYVIGGLTGFLLGFIILHPFSMLFQGLIHPTFSLHFELLADAFNPHHLPMAFFFGILGFLFGCTTVFFLFALLKEKKRVKLLEGLLPICSFCKQIRDDKGTWNQM